MIRFECLEILARKVGDGLVIHTGGGTAHEWNSLRPGPANLDGPVGGITGISLGLAMALPQWPVVGLETDGGLLMNLSVLPDLGNIQPPNLTIIAFDNEMYESTGGQPSASAGKTDFAAMARAAGIERSTTVRSLSEFEQAVNGALKNEACDFIVTKVEVGVKKVPYLETSGHEMKFEFVRYIERKTGIKVLTPPEQQLPAQFIKG